MKGLKEKNVLITGSSSGIGQAIAIEFAKYGSKVAINYRSDLEGARATEKHCQKFGVETLILKGDVSDELQAKNLIIKTIEGFGTLDILINNAAIQNFVPSHERTTELFDKTIAVNLRAPFILSRETISHFLSRKYPGVIINISSPHEIIPKPGYVDYAVCKTGLKNLTQTLALEYGGNGIRVNTVAPGATDTKMNSAWTQNPERRAKIEKSIPLEKIARPDEISPAVVFLASDLASYITGVTLFVDGGAVLYPERRFETYS